MLNQTQNNSLLVDIGNSAIKWTLSSSSGLLAMSRAQYPENISDEFFSTCFQGLEPPNEIIASCVAHEDVWQAFVKACDKSWAKEAHKIESLKEGFGVINAYKDASSLGADRWCALLGGKANTDYAFMVIDAGSALTIDVVNESGKHLGGYIVPGLNMIKQSLGIQTAQVQVESGVSEPRSLSLGKSTTDCVEAGSYMSVISMLEAVFEKESKRFKKFQVYITGGNAEEISGLLSFTCVMIPDLVLCGLAVIAANEL